MSTFTRNTLCLLVVLSLVGPAWSMGGGRGTDAEPALNPATQAAWKPLLEEGRQHADALPGWEQTVTHLAAAGLTPEEGREVLAPARQAMQEGLPAGTVLAKLDEGAAKGVPADGLRQAAEKRVEELRRARLLLAGNGFPASEDRGGGLLVSTALALESGVPASVLEAALVHGRGTPPGRIKAVVEAGEALYLDGLDPNTVGMLMTDCLDRQLRRPEVLRVVRFAREQHGQGLDGKSIRAALWGSGGEMGGSAAGAGAGGMGGGMGPSFGMDSGGPGMGGQGHMGGNRSPHGGPR